MRKNRPRPLPFLSPLAVLLVLVAPALASTRAGVEREVSPPPFGESTHARIADAAAFHDGSGVVVWSDLRNRRHNLAYGSRLSADGSLLDPLGIPLFLDPAVPSRPLGAARANGAWVVFWVEGPRLYARRLDDQGTPAGEPRLLAEHAETLHARSTRAFALTRGSTILFAWSNLAQTGGLLVDSGLHAFHDAGIGGMDITAAAVAGEDFVVFGRQPDGSGIASRIHLNGGATYVSLPAVAWQAAWTGEHFVVHFVEGSSTRLSRLNADLEPVRDVPTPIEPGMEPIAFFSGDDADVVIFWRTSSSVQVSRLDGGDFLTGWTELDTWSDGSNESPVIVRMGADYLVIRPDLETLVVSSALALTARRPAVLLAHAAQGQFAAPPEGGDSVAFLAEDWAGRRVMIAPRPGAAARPAPHHPMQSEPAIATSGRTSLVVWRENDTATRIVALPLDASAQPLRDRPIVLHTDALSRLDPWSFASVYGPSVAWTGQLYIVSWVASQQLGYVRITEAGQLLDPQPIAVERRVPADREEQSEPVLARAGDVTLLAWTEGLRFDCSVCIGRPSTVRALRLTPDGQRIDAAPVEVGGGPYAQRPRLAARGDTMLITWSGPGIQGRRMVNGILDPQPFTIAAGSWPAVARHRDGFLVVWAVGSPSLTGTFDLVAADVSVTRAVGEPFAVAAATFGFQGPVAWTMASGLAAVAYSRTDAATGMVPRLFYRVIDESGRTRGRLVGR